MKSITAYIRLANEENTIIPCLKSIENIFDKILIIYSEVTDKSLKLIEIYADQCNTKNLLIKKYPHKVLPPHSNEYKTGEYNLENSLESYYNFGLQYIDTELLMKIDADQIYFKSKLKELVNKAMDIENDIYIGCKGYNCIVKEREIKLYKKQIYNGGHDHFIITTSLVSFIQEKFWEKLLVKNKQSCQIQNNKYWFHFKKGHRYNNKFVPGSSYPDDSLLKFDENLVKEYRENILPLLVESNSEYQYLKY